MTRLEIATRLLAGWAANPNERGTAEAAAKTALFLADALLAAAEKPAEGAGCNGHGEVSALMQDGSRQTDACPFCVGAGRAEKPAEAAPVVCGEKCEGADGACPGRRDATHYETLPSVGTTRHPCCGHAECCKLDAPGSRWIRYPLAKSTRAEKPAPVAALPWVVRRRDGSRVIAHCAHGADARYFRDALYTGHVEVSEVAAAPTVAAVVPVLFNGTGRAMLASGERATQTGPEGWSAEVSPDRKWLAIFVGLRPGEDAGETLAKMLAPVGRGP